MSYSLPQYRQLAFPRPLKLENPITCILAAVVRAETISNTTNIHNEGKGILKVKGFLRLTGFFELLAGALLLEYGNALLTVPQCPALPHCGGPLPNPGPYNTVGLVFVVVGLIQIAASFFIGRNRKLKPDAVANTGSSSSKPPDKYVAITNTQVQLRRLPKPDHRLYQNPEADVDELPASFEELEPSRLFNAGGFQIWILTLIVAAVPVLFYCTSWHRRLNSKM